MRKGFLKRCAPGWRRRIGRPFVGVACVALLLFAALWTFGDLAEDMVAGERIVDVDANLATWLHGHGSAPLIRFMRLVSLVHGIAGIAAMSLVTGAWLLWRRSYAWLVALVGVVPGGLAVNTLLKLAYQRPRPSFTDPLVHLDTFSFPSGHVAGTTLFYGFLLALAWPRLRGARNKALAVVAASALVALVTLSRMYLGAHYLSDVLAAVAEAIVWLCLCLVALHSWQRRTPTTGAAS